MRLVVVQGDSDLLEVVDALQASSCLPRQLHCGSKSEINTAMIAMTTRSSISVNPLVHLVACDLSDSLPGLRSNTLLEIVITLRIIAHLFAIARGRVCRLLYSVSLALRSLEFKDSRHRSRRFSDPDSCFTAGPAGNQFLMGDGLALFIKSSINPSVYGGLCSRNLGEIVSGDPF